MVSIRFQGVSKSFGDVLVIQDLNLTIQHGEFFTFLGPSGCGKSTLLHMVAGLEGVREGLIYFDDQPINPVPPQERDVALVFQTYALYPHMKVYENLAFPLKMKKVSTDIIHQEVQRVAGMLGLEKLLQRKPKELSGGERQRVALGRAIIRKPKVFLMDEPLSNLDAKLREAMRGELKKLHQALGITTIYVTHDQQEAMSLSDRIAILYEGKIQQCGTPEEIYTQPTNLFVAQFIGSPSMNLIPGLVKTLSPLTVACQGMILHPQTSTPPSGQKVMVGIRPEDIRISSQPFKEAEEVTVSFIESAGSFLWVDARWGDISIKGKASVSAALKPGERAYLHFPLASVHYFDGITGKRL